MILIVHWPFKKGKLEVLFLVHTIQCFCKMYHLFRGVLKNDHHKVTMTNFLLTVLCVICTAVMHQHKVQEVHLFPVTFPFSPRGRTSTTVELILSILVE